MVPAWVPAAISAGASLLGMGQQSRENDQAEAFSTSAATTAHQRNVKNYKRSRKDFLKDDKRNRKRYLRDIRKGPERQRAAAERAGFNPLSVAGVGPQNNQASALTAGATQSAGGYAPLSSANMLTDTIESIGSIFTGEAAREQSVLQLEEDLAKLELEKLAALQVVPKMAETANPTVIPKPIKIPKMTDGLTPEQIRQGITINPRTGQMNKPTQWWNPTGENEVIPAMTTTGGTTVDNKLTGGPISFPGNDEPWGVDELATAVVVGGPQVVYNYGGKARDTLGNWRWNQIDKRMHEGIATDLAYPSLNAADSARAARAETLRRGKPPGTLDF